MKNILSIFGVIFILVLACITVFAVDRHSSAMCTSGQSWYVGGSGPGNLSCIQAAIDNASSGDHIFVYSLSSPYFETILMNKQLFLQGENRETTIIDGGHTGDVITVVADDCQISGFTVRYCGGTWHPAGIRLLSDNNIVSNNIITLARNGIFIQSTINNTIKDNFVIDNGYHGIRVEYSSDISILNNTIASNAGDGIYFWETTDSTMQENTIKNNVHYGFMLGAYCTNNVIFHNNIIANHLVNAHDSTGNFWDDGYLSGGNYWDDYDGVDDNDDKIGDTPYFISGGNSSDQYPLMFPYPYQEPESLIHINGGIGVTIWIQDQRENLTNELSYTIEITYDYLLRQDVITTDSGTIPLEGDVEIQLQNPRLLGFGAIEIDVQAGNVHNRQVGKIIGPFVLIQ